MAPDHDDGPPSASDFGGLVARVDVMERVVTEARDSTRVLEIGHQQLISQMAELRLHQLDSDKERRQMARDVKETTAVAREVLDSTRDIRETVQTLRDVQAAGRLGARLSRMTGAVLFKLAALVTAIAGAWWAWKGGPPPKP